MISQRLFRRIAKPDLRAVFSRVHPLAPYAKLSFRSGGDLRPILPHLSEIGIYALNPIHLTETGMEPAAPKRDSAGTSAAGKAAG